MALAQGVAAALELSKALEAKLEGAARSEAAALTACLAGLVSGGAGGDGAAAAGDGGAAGADGAAAPRGAELAAAAATSCMVPRGKFDLALHDGAPNTLHGIVSRATLHRELRSVGAPPG